MIVTVQITQEMELKQKEQKYMCELQEFKSGED
jgi:hypothetical protein